MTNTAPAVLADPRFHVEGQTSTEGPRWQIWDNQRHRARFRNIASSTDAANICAELNRISRPSPATTGEDAVKLREALLEARIDLDLARNRLIACTVAAIAWGKHREQVEWGDWNKEAAAAVTRIDALLEQHGTTEGPKPKRSGPLGERSGGHYGDQVVQSREDNL